MNASLDALSAPPVNLMTGQAYRESLRHYRPRVFVDGREVTSVADEPALSPGVNALAYESARQKPHEIGVEPDAR